MFHQTRYILKLCGLFNQTIWSIKLWIFISQSVIFKIFQKHFQNSIYLSTCTTFLSGKLIYHQSRQIEIHTNLARNNIYEKTYHTYMCICVYRSLSSTLLETRMSSQSHYGVFHFHSFVLYRWNNKSIQRIYRRSAYTTSDHSQTENPFRLATSFAVQFKESLETRSNRTKHQYNLFQNNYLMSQSYWRIN